MELIEACDGFFLKIQQEKTISPCLKNKYRCHCLELSQQLQKNILESEIKAVECLDRALIVLGTDLSITENIKKWHIENSKVIRELNYDVISIIKNIRESPLHNYTASASQNLVIFDYFDPQEILNNILEPFKIIKGAIHWSAIKLWKDPLYIFGKFGHRLVPFEIGDNYIDAEWNQKILPIKDLILKSTLSTMYMAQYDLLGHIPELDSEVDDLDLLFLLNEGRNKCLERNVWLGYNRCFTPLHHDPYSNVYVQVVGCKHVFLVDPIFSDKISIDNGFTNTSSLRFFPGKKSEIPFKYTLLNSGDVLYIPKGWWHQFESVHGGLCISVSHWI